MSKEKQKREYESKQLIEELSKMPPMVIATAYLHAINYTLYGEDVTEKWLTATQNASILGKAYRKGFMDGVNDQAERYKDSAYRQKHDSELLDKVAEKIISWDSKVKGIREDEVCFFTIENILQGIEELKAEVENEQNNKK